ncbi:MAG: DUF4013 domain-containing protein [Chloroflexi bacterium]|nr:DUF4013 domain-containing protein [Chloroflexota bacterium]
MTGIAATSSFKNALTFSFQDKKWGTKYLVAGLLVIASAVIPLIPLLFLLGYKTRIMRRIANDDGQPALPDWNNWGDLLIDGLRLAGLYVVYYIPGIVLALIGFLAMFIPAVNSHFDSGASSFAPVGVILLMWFFMGIGMLWCLAASFFLGPAQVHMVAKSRFSAGFEFSDWWKVMRANLGGFVLAFVLAIGLQQLASGIISISVLTVCLIFLVPFIAIAVSLYELIVTSTLYAIAYREAIDALAVPQVAS